MPVARKNKGILANRGVTDEPLSKPREECSYSEIYPKLDASKKLAIYKYSSSKTNGHAGTNGHAVNNNNNNNSNSHKKNVGTKKRLFRQIQPFALDEPFVTNAMNAVGYSETDEFEMPLHYIRTVEPPSSENLDESKSLRQQNNRVEYDMDEQDGIFLKDLNERRTKDKDALLPISRELFEIAMTLLECEWYLLELKMPPKKKAAVMDEIAEVDEQRCTICDESECDNSNAIVFCDSCDVAVHQECYGVPFIPEGQWLCAQCQISRRRKAACVFCPNKIGALKPTDTQHWAHVVCALWIPEASIRNTIYMEPITGLNKVPKSRWKLICYICKGRMGACIQCCNKTCFQAYHPTCARKAGIYMKMNQGPLMALQDSLTCVTYCDRHTPEDYQVTMNVTKQVQIAQDYYAQSKEDNDMSNSSDYDHLSTVVKATKFVRKRSKNVKPWRTAQGIPVIPKMIVTRITERMSKFHIMKCREFIWELSRYWALKRQNKRGAALSKRLQMALEASQSNTAISEPPVEEYERLFNYIVRLKNVADQLKLRETSKLKDAETTNDQINSQYFSSITLLDPVIRRIKKIEFKNPTLPKLSMGGITTETIQLKYDNLIYSSIDECERDFNKLCDDPTAAKLLKNIKPLFETARQQQYAFYNNYNNNNQANTNKKRGRKRRKKA